MKDLVHHLNHIQKKVVSSSRKADIVNSANEDKSNGSKESTKFPLNTKKKIYGSQ